jgi:hypothetical protein
MTACIPPHIAPHPARCDHQQRDTASEFYTLAEVNYIGLREGDDFRRTRLCKIGRETRCVIEYSWTVQSVSSAGYESREAVSGFSWSAVVGF